MVKITFASRLDLRRENHENYVPAAKSLQPCIQSIENFTESSHVKEPNQDPARDQEKNNTVPSTYIRAYICKNIPCSTSTTISSLRPVLAACRNETILIRNAHVGKPFPRKSRPFLLDRTLPTRNKLPAESFSHLSTLG